MLSSTGIANCEFSIISISLALRVEACLSTLSKIEEQATPFAMLLSAVFPPPPRAAAAAAAASVVTATAAVQTRLQFRMCFHTVPKKTTT
mmetsp:Transcript_12490/g.24000  ORF Transcript_12490/g.24000 Transcript_12490/m.24000 type:complete len:90 (-) Transcript_12490:319-588(-)